MPDSLLLFIAIALLCGAAIAEARRLAPRRPDRIHGFWHYDAPAARGMIAWEEACRRSNAQSLSRRGRLDDH